MNLTRQNEKDNIWEIVNYFTPREGMAKVIGKKELSFISRQKEKFVIVPYRSLINEQTTLYYKQSDCDVKL